MIELSWISFILLEVESLHPSTLEVVVKTGNNWVQVKINLFAVHFKQSQGEWTPCLHLVGPVWRSDRVGFDLYQACGRFNVGDEGDSSVQFSSVLQMVVPKTEIWGWIRPVKRVFILEGHLVFLEMKLHVFTTKSRGSWWNYSVRWGVGCHCQSHLSHVLSRWGQGGRCSMLLHWKWRRGCRSMSSLNPLGSML